MLDVITFIQFYLIIVLSGLTLYTAVKLAGRYTLVSAGTDAPQGQGKDLETEIKNLLKGHQLTVDRKLKKAGKSTKSKDTSSGTDMLDVVNAGIELIPKVMPLVEQFMKKPPETK